MYIFLDESGDLGFDFSKPKTTRKFVITLLVCFDGASRKDFAKSVRRTLKNKLNHGKKGSRKVTELKGTATTIAIKEYFLRNVIKDNWGIYTLILNKARVEDRLRTKAGKKKLYNFLSRVLLERLDLGNAQRNVELVVDRSKNKEEIRDFNQYLANQLEAALPLNTMLYISHLTSEESPGLQATDLFCWGVFRKYESGDTGWYEKFSSKVRVETEYLREQA